MALWRRSGRTPEMHRHPDPDSPVVDSRFSGEELGPDSGVYFIEQLLRPDRDGDAPTGAPSALAEREDDQAEPGAIDAAGGEESPVERTPRPGSARQRSLESRLGIVLAILIVASLGLATAVAVKASQDGEAADRAIARFTAAPSPGPVIVAVGDESVERSSRSAAASRQWPVLLRQDLGGRFVPLTASGAGYVTKGASGRTFVAEAGRVPRDADVVLFFGGGADAKTSVMGIAKAATAAFSEASQRAPKARIIVIGPLPGPSTTASSTDLLRRALRLSAATAGVTWQDPIEDRWLGAPSVDTTLRATDEQRVASRVRAVVQSPSPSPTAGD